MKCGIWNQMKIWSSHLLDNFKQLSHEPEKFKWLNGIRTHDLCEGRCSALTNWATKSHSWEQVNLLGSCFPVKGMSYERNVIWSAVFEIKWRYDIYLHLTLGYNNVSEFLFETLTLSHLYHTVFYSFHTCGPCSTESSNGSPTVRFWALWTLFLTNSS